MGVRGWTLKVNADSLAEMMALSSQQRSRNVPHLEHVWPGQYFVEQEAEEDTSGPPEPEDAGQSTADPADELQVSVAESEHCLETEGVHDVAP